MKQRNLNTVFANISKTTFPTSDSFLLIMSHIENCIFFLTKRATFISISIQHHLGMKVYTQTKQAFSLQFQWSQSTYGIWNAAEDFNMVILTKKLSPLCGEPGRLTGWVLNCVGMKEYLFAVFLLYGKSGKSGSKADDIPADWADGPTAAEAKGCGYAAILARFFFSVGLCINEWKVI